MPSPFFLKSLGKTPVLTCSLDCFEYVIKQPWLPYVRFSRKKAKGGNYCSNDLLGECSQEKED